LLRANLAARLLLFAALRLRDWGAPAGRLRYAAAAAAHWLPERSNGTVEVTASVRALDGATLGARNRLEFEPPRRAVVNTSPYAGDNALDPGTRF
jgi:hypothetical protein